MSSRTNFLTADEKWPFTASDAGDLSPEAMTHTKIMKLALRDLRRGTRFIFFLSGFFMFATGTYQTVRTFFTDGRTYQTLVFYSCIEAAPKGSKCSPICFGETLDLNYWTYSLCQKQTVSEEECKKLKKLFNYEFGKSLSKSHPDFNSDFCIYQCIAEKTRPCTYGELAEVIGIILLWIMTVLSYVIDWIV